MLTVRQGALDVPQAAGIVPYAGLGLGAGYATADIDFAQHGYGYGKGDFGLAYQVGAGVKFDLSDGVALDLGYRYKSIHNIDFEDIDGNDTYAIADIHSQVLQAGLTFKF